MLREPFKDWQDVQRQDLDGLLREARELSHGSVGRTLQCFIPGRMMYNRTEGRYPTISITGSSCALNCDHCQRKILETMVPATSPRELYDQCLKAANMDSIGVLISGGSMKDGSLPWARFMDVIADVKRDTGLKITIHSGLIDETTAKALKDAGVDELLIDVIGDEGTMRKVYHLDVGLDAMESSLDALKATGLPLIPHIVFGLDYGKVVGEMRALEMVAQRDPYALVIVVLIPLKGSPMYGTHAPAPSDVARFIAAARFRMPGKPLALSCARPTGRHREELDVLAVEAGINRIAMPSEEALHRARELGLDIEFHLTCCSKSY